MEENYYQGPTRWLGLSSNLLSLFGFFLLGGFLGQFFGLLAVLALMEFPTQNIVAFQNQLMDFMAHPQKYEGGFRALMAFQWFSALFTFVLASWAYLKFIEKRSVFDLNRAEAPGFQVFSWAILTVLVSMPAMEYLIEWNQHIQLPVGFEDIEKAMQSTEKSTAELTKFLLNFQSDVDFGLGIIVIAGMAALGEEIFFRGVLQSIFERYIGNKHVAIWIAAAVFSFIHFQFYGFFPRMFLGAFFGYLYVWFRSIWIPIAAHFFNNAWTLLMHYLYQQKNITIDPAEMVNSIPWWSALLSVVLVGFYIRRLHTYRNES
jgi:membrane protease YdiL (CAAX protease family)